MPRELTVKTQATGPPLAAVTSRTRLSENCPARGHTLARQRGQGIQGPVLWFQVAGDHRLSAADNSPGRAAGVGSIL